MADPPGADATPWDLAPCGYLVLADDGTILEANRSILDALQRTRADVVGRLRFADLLPVGARIYHETHLLPLLRLHGRFSELALDLCRADGGRVPVLLNAHRLVPPDGPPTVHVVSFEVTQRRDYEREILHAKQIAEDAAATALALSRTLQATLIPPLPPVIDGLDVAAAYRPAGSGEEVGGDFYDIFQVAEHEWVFVIGDVEGKGVEAAAVTALARHVLRAAAVSSTSPSDALRTLNDVLRRSATTRLLTAQVLRMTRDGDGWSAVLASAGHEPAVCRRAGQDAEELVVPGTILGCLPAPPLSERRLDLGPGDLVLLTTDGVQEARDPVSGEFYGAARLLDHLTGAPAEAVVTSLVADVLAFSAGVTRDDIAVVGIVVGDRSAGAAEGQPHLAGTAASRSVHWGT